VCRVDAQEHSRSAVGSARCYRWHGRDRRNATSARVKRSGRGGLAALVKEDVPSAHESTTSCETVWSGRTSLEFKSPVLSARASTGGPILLCSLLRLAPVSVRSMVCAIAAAVRRSRNKRELVGEQYTSQTSVEVSALFEKMGTDVTSHSDCFLWYS